MNIKKDKPVVWIVCSGLGHINRGYESFTRECYDALATSESFDLYLLKGGGEKVGKEIVVNNFPRQQSAAKWIGKLLRKEPYFVEQLSFFLSMIPLLKRKKPAVIFYSDFILGTFLWQLRRRFQFSYKLLYSNGAPNGPPFTRTDHIQQLLPLYVKQALKGGTDISCQTLLPYAIQVNKAAAIQAWQQTALLRKQLGLPQHKKIVISVGAVNTHHKRMDYVVREFSRLQQESFFLVILGQTDANSSSILELAEELLPADNYIIKQVESETVRNYLFASDYFVLASLNEGLPRVLPEALSAGLLPIVHDYGVTRETLGKHGIFADLTVEQNLTGAINRAIVAGISKEELLNYCFDTYSWDKLTPQYEAMITKLVNEIQ